MTTVDVPEGIGVALIAAVAENGVIGAAGGIPWQYPADLRHFKETTVGHPVILGRRTYESIASRLGGPLPDRLNVVLSRSDLDLPAGATRAEGLQEAVDIASEAAADRSVDTVYVAGGAAVYEQFLPVTDRLVLTEIHRTYDGDTRFPAWDEASWAEIEREDRGELSFVVYERR